MNEFSNTRKEQIEDAARHLKKDFGISDVGLEKLLEFGKSCAMVGAAEARTHALENIKDGAVRAKITERSVFEILGYTE